MLLNFQITKTQTSIWQISVIEDVDEEVTEDEDEQDESSDDCSHYMSMASL